MANPFEEELQRRQVGAGTGDVPATQEATPAAMANPFEEELQRRSLPQGSEATAPYRRGSVLGVSGGLDKAVDPETQQAYEAENLRNPPVIQRPEEVAPFSGGGVLGGEGGMGIETALDPNTTFNYEEYIAQRNPFEIARRRGIEPEGAEAELRSSYMKLPPQQREKYASELVNRWHQVTSDGNADHVPVQYDEGLDTHIFKDPKDGKWKPLNDLGMDKEDAKEFMKYVVAPTVAGGVAGAAGTAVGAPATGAFWALTLDAAVAGGFRANDIEDLIKEGLIPPTISPGVEGAKESGLAVASFALGDAGGRFFRKRISGVDDIPMNVDIDRKTVNDLLQRFDEKYGDTMPNLTLDARIGLVANTAKEKSVAERVRSRRDVLAQADDSRKAMVDRRFENEEDFKRGLDVFLGTVGKQDDPGVFRSSGIGADEILASSTRIIDTLEGNVRTKLKQYDEALANAYQNAQKTFDDLLGEGIDPKRLPVESTYGAIDGAREVFRREMDSQYDVIKEAAGNQRIYDVAPLKQELRTIKEELRSDGKFNRMMEDLQGLEPRPVIREGGRTPVAEPEDDLLEAFFGTSFKRQDSGVLVPDTIKRQRADAQETYGYEDIDKALKTLRRRKRKLPANTDKEVWATFQRVEDALKGIRDTGLRSIDPELAASQQALDATYRIGNDALDRSLLDKLSNQYLKPRADQPGVLKPDTFDKLFKRNAGTETVRDLQVLANEDVFGTGVGQPIRSLGLKDTVRKGLLGQLRDQNRIVAGTGGEARTVSPEAFSKFKEDYYDALNYALEPGQLEKIESMTSLRSALQSAEKDYMDAKKRIEQFPWGSKSAADDPSLLFKKTWGTKATDPSGYKRSLDLREAFREAGDPEGLLTDYRKMIANDMMRQIQMDGHSGYIDPTKLRRYLDDHQEKLQVWYTSNGKSGTDLVNNLKTYSDIGHSILETAGIAHADKDATMAALNSVARAYVGVFTTPGRVLTAIKQLGGGQSIKREADFILNPGKYVKNQDFYNVLNSNSFRTLQRAGGHALMLELREDMGQPEQEEPEPQGLFGQ